MKWRYFRALMNEFFDDEDDLRITVSGDVEDIYPVITIITPEESDDDGGYPILIGTDLDEIEDGYFVWSPADIVDFSRQGMQGG